MFCSNCGKKLDVDAAFCSGCGYQIITTTPLPPQKKSLLHMESPQHKQEEVPQKHRKLRPIWVFAISVVVVLLMAGVGFLVLSRGDLDYIPPMAESMGNDVQNPGIDNLRDYVYNY